MAMQHQQHVQYNFAPPVHAHQQHSLAHIQHYQPPQTPVQQPPASGTVAPADTYHNQPPPVATTSQQAASSSTTAAPPQTAPNVAPLVAQGDWTKNLVHLAKTAELKKHALTLQLHTAHIVSAHSQLEAKSKAKQDIHEQRSKLDAERSRLLKALQEVNSDRDKADMTEAAIDKECIELRAKIQIIQDGDYAASKHQVDALRAELGMPPMPPLQQTLEEKSTTYLNDRRLDGPLTQTQLGETSSSAQFATASKRPASESISFQEASPLGKRPRGRPKGSKNKAKGATNAAGEASAVTT